MPLQVGQIDSDRPVLIAGPTASGKSALAMEIAARTGGPIVNADALQVFADWRVLTARPGPEDEATLPHLLYGHVPGDVAYSVGAWLRDLAPLLGGAPPVIVGGTGLYFTRLTEGLAEIPPPPAEIREEAGRRLRDGGTQALLAGIDAETRARIDVANTARVRRAWEVLRTTGRGLADWQDETPAPLLPLSSAQAFVVDAPKAWLLPRIERRTDQMLASGAIDEARRNLASFHPERPSSKAIGAAELVAYLSGGSLDEARTRMIVATRRYAKRQRTWLRNRMRDWQPITVT